MFEDIKPPKLDSKTPNEASDDSGKASDDIETLELDNTPEPTNRHKHFVRIRKWWAGLSQNWRFAVVAAALLLFAVWAIGFYYISRPDSDSSISISKRAKLEPKTVASPLTGVQIDPVLATRPVTGIMVENSLDARPQSGIQQAGVVFEAIAEGGITRFLTLYQESKPQYVGPVRSLRPYYIDWATPFDAGIAHVGGSPEALQQIRSHGKDLDQFFNSGYYWRESSRAAPHNVYTSFKLLDALNKKKGYKHSKFVSWPRKAKEAPLATPTVKAININIASYYFNSRYVYDAKSNNYLRYEGGQKHLIIRSANDKHPVQLHPKVLIAMVMPYGIESDGHHSEYGTSGKGTAFIFQDGGVTKAVWHKKNRATQLSFTDSKGKPILLDPGQTWLVAVGASNMVSYKIIKPPATPPSPASQ